MKLFIVGLSAARNLTVSKAHCYWKRSIIGTFRADNIHPYSDRVLLASLYRKIYFSTNSSARTYISGVTFFAFPVTTFRTT